MLNLHCRKALVVALSSVLAVSSITAAAVFGSQDAHTWGIENAQLGIAPGSVITNAKLTIHNAAFDKASSVKTASVRLLNNPDPGTTSYTDARAGDYFANCGVLLAQLTPASLGTAPRNVVLDLGQINDSTADILKNLGALKVNLADGSNVAYSSAMVALLDYAGSGRSFGFGIDSDGFIFTDMSLELTVAPMTGTEPAQTLLFSTSNNTPPILNAIADQTARAGQALNLTVSATDADNDALTYSAANLPSGAVFAEGVFSWTPSAAQVGDYEVTFTVSDGTGSDTRVVNITVTDGTAPVEIVIDNRDSATETVGTWPVSGGVNPYADDAVYNRELGNSFSFLFTAPETGWYEVAMWWTEFSSRSAVTPVRVEHADSTDSLTVNQLADGGKWNKLGSWRYEAGKTYRVTLLTLADRSSICADAVRFVKTAEPQLPTEVVIDNEDPATSKIGSWLPSGGVGPYNGQSVYNRELGNSFSFLFTAPETGWYEASMWWTEFSSRSTVTPVTIEHANGTVAITVNQQIDGAKWNTLGAWQYQAGQTYRVTLHTLADRSSICADAVRFVKTAAPELPSEIVIDNTDIATAIVGSWPVSGGANPYSGSSVYNRYPNNSFSFIFTAPETGAYEVSMWWTEFSSRSSAAPVRVQHAGGTESLTVNQQTDGGQWNTLGTWQYEAGQAYRVTLLTLPDYTTICADAVRFVKTGTPGKTVKADFTADVTAGKAPLTVGFTDMSVSSGVLSQWQWDFNNDGTVDSTQQNPSYTYNDAGTYAVRLTVTGPDGTNSAVKTGFITVEAVSTNNPPVLASIGARSVQENSSLTIKLSAVDPDGDPLTYSAADLPAGAAFSGSSFTWTPSFDQAGRYDVQFAVSDGKSEDTETVRITVLNANQLPQIAPVADRAVVVPNAVSFVVAATDPDNDVLTLTAKNLPAGASFVNKVFSWSPKASQAGTYDVTFTADDGNGGLDSINVRITVKASANWVRLTYDDFERGWGNYTSGGSNCLLYRHSKYAHQGSYAANLQAGGTTAALTLTNGLNVTGYSEIKIDFWYIPVSMDASSDTFRLDYWDGSKWIMLKRWVNFRDFTSFRFYSDSVTVSKSDVTFPSGMKIRFVCEAADAVDDVMIDEIAISAR